MTRESDENVLGFPTRRDREVYDGKVCECGHAWFVLVPAPPAMTGTVAVDAECNISAYSGRMICSGCGALQPWSEPPDGLTSMSDRDTAALRDSVIERMARQLFDDAWHHRSEPGEWEALPPTVRADFVAQAATLLDVALAVTACTTCGGTGDAGAARAGGKGPWTFTACPVCGGTPPRALVMRDELRQVGERIVERAIPTGNEYAQLVRTGEGGVLGRKCEVSRVPAFVLTERNEQGK